MEVTVALEHRFVRTPDGNVWTESFFANSFWQRYLTVFDGVRVIARVRDTRVAEDGWKRVDGNGVSMAPLPYYLGPLQYLRRRRQVVKAARAAIPEDGAIILRVSSQVANCVEPVLQRTSHPFGVEVVADPYGVFAPGAVRHPLRPLLRLWFPMRLRRQCQAACAAAYVTREALQLRYPASPKAFQTHYSSVELGPECFAASPRSRRTGGMPRIIFVGSLEVSYKGPDVLLKALAECRDRGLDCHLTLLGDGRFRPELQALTASLGLDGHVHFAGLLPSGAAVREYLDRADLFVLPSREEGLPRAMVEAMARGLPCIGSTVGGIPELLPADCMAPAGDVHALASRICEVAADPARLEEMSRRNLATASEYREEVLSQRRTALYLHLRNTTRDWLAQTQKWHNVGQRIV